MILQDVLTESFLIFELPRLLLALSVGAALGLIGVMTQTLFRNELAEPGVLGVSSLASLVGMVVLIMLPLSWHQPWIIGAVMGVAAWGGAFLLFSVWQWRGLEASVVLLMGVLINAFCGGAIQFLLHWMESDQLKSWLFWGAGQFANARYDQSIILMCLICVAVKILMRHISALDGLLLGEEVAYSLGVNVKRFQPLLLLGSASLQAYVLMVSGQIGFIGLMAPHLARQWWGASHKQLIPFSILIGGLLLVVADFISQHVVEGGDLPVGIFTTLMGVPLLIHALLKYRLF